MRTRRAVGAPTLIQSPATTLDRVVKYSCYTPTSTRTIARKANDTSCNSKLRWALEIHVGSKTYTSHIKLDVRVGSDAPHLTALAS